MASTGEGLLFIHGAGSRGIVWQLQLLAFPRATAPDLPGRTGGADGYLDALRAEVGPGGPRIVAGHSLGGAIALRWALRHPEEVRAIILIGTGARLRVAPAFLAGIKAGDPATVEQFGAAWFAPETPDRLREKSLALLRATPVLLADLTAADGFDVMGEVGRLALPTLVMCGTEDRLTPVKFSQYLHDQIRGSDLVLVPGAGHMMMIEQPQATNGAIHAFLDRLD
jgi:pimeloyl-ACP methyl ester carboxylesterase